MKEYQPLDWFPLEIQQNWMLTLQRHVSERAEGHFYLVAIRKTEGRGYEGQRIIALVLDENGYPTPSVPVAFAFSTAPRYMVDSEFLWSPPPPQKADIFPTQGSGQIDHIQNDVVKAGQPGGISVYMLHPKYSSDVLEGAGMLADHTGLHLTFQLRRKDVVPLAERLAAIEARLDALEGKL